MSDLRPFDSYDTRTKDTPLWNNRERQVINSVSYLRWRREEPNQVRHAACTDLVIEKKRDGSRRTTYIVGIYKSMPMGGGGTQRALMHRSTLATWGQALYEFGSLYGQMVHNGRRELH